MTSKKSNLGIHDVSKYLNQEIDSRLDQIIFNLGIRNVDKQHKAIGASVMKGKYISEFDDIPESLKDTSVEEVDRTPAENLAYQVGWTTLVLKWEEDERKGLQAKTPSNDFKWKKIAL